MQACSGCSQLLYRRRSQAPTALAQEGSRLRAQLLLEAREAIGSSMAISRPNKAVGMLGAVQRSRTRQGATLSAADLAPAQHQRRRHYNKMASTCSQTLYCNLQSGSLTPCSR